MTPVFRILIALSCCLLMTSHAAMADAPLLFHSAPQGPREQMAVSFLTDTGNLPQGIPVSIAASDLNGDGVPEWIIKADAPGCTYKAACRFFIVGLRLGRFAILGMTDAGKIAVSQEKAYGVRRLMLYNNPNNDFTYQYFGWSPPAEAFVPD